MAFVLQPDLLHTAVIDIAAAVKNDLRDILFSGALCEQFAHLAGSALISAVFLEILFHS